MNVQVPVPIEGLAIVVRDRDYKKDIEDIESDVLMPILTRDGRKVLSLDELSYLDTAYSRFRFMLTKNGVPVRVENEIFPTIKYFTVSIDDLFAFYEQLIYADLSDVEGEKGNVVVPLVFHDMETTLFFENIPSGITYREVFTDGCFYAKFSVPLRDLKSFLRSYLMSVFFGEKPRVFNHSYDPYIVPLDQFW